MNRISRLAIIAGLVAITSCLVDIGSAERAFPRWHQLEKLNYNFEKWMQDAGRKYPHGSRLWTERRKIFEERLASIKHHNSDPARTWKRGVNQFSDWTAAEWKAYNRARVPKRKNMGVRPMVHAMNPTYMPEFVDYRKRVDPPVLTAIKNQGSCGSCWAHVATEQMESAFALRFGQLPVLSAQQITSCTPDCYGCGGGNVLDAWVSVATGGGLNEEWTYPYVDFFAPQMSAKYTQPCQNITKRFPIIRDGDHSFRFTWWPKANVSAIEPLINNVASVLQSTLATEGPVAAAVGSGQWADYESGVLQNNYSTPATNKEWQSLDHAVQVVGYGYDYDLALGYWIVRNSWGTNYGEAGYIRLLRPEVEPCGSAMGSKTCGTSGVLADLHTVFVKALDNQNGHYF